MANKAEGLKLFTPANNDDAAAACWFQLGDEDSDEEVDEEVDVDDVDELSCCLSDLELELVFDDGDDDDDDGHWFREDASCCLDWFKFVLLLLLLLLAVLTLTLDCLVFLSLNKDVDDDEEDEEHEEDDDDEESLLLFLLARFSLAIMACIVAWVLAEQLWLNLSICDLRLW